MNLSNFLESRGILKLSNLAFITKRNSSLMQNRSRLEAFWYLIFTENKNILASLAISESKNYKYEQLILIAKDSACDTCYREEFCRRSSDNEGSANNGQQLGPVIAMKK